MSYFGSFFAILPINNLCTKKESNFHSWFRRSVFYHWTIRTEAKNNLFLWKNILAGAAKQSFAEKQSRPTEKQWNRSQRKTATTIYLIFWDFIYKISNYKICVYKVVKYFLNLLLEWGKFWNLSIYNLFFMSLHIKFFYQTKLRA